MASPSPVPVGGVCTPPSSQPAREATAPVPRASAAGGELRPRRCGQQEHEQSHAQRRQRAARQREVEPRAQPWSHRRGRQPQPVRALRGAGQADGQHQPHRQHAALRVPVGERLIEPALAGAAIDEIHQPGHKALRQPVDHDRERPGHQRGLHHPRSTRVAQKGGRGDQRGRVERQPLRVVPRLAGQRRPGGGQQHPRRQPQQPPTAARPGAPRGSGRSAATATTITSSQATRAATRRARSKKPPEKKASTVGPARRTAVETRSTADRIAGAPYSRP